MWDSPNALSTVTPSHGCLMPFCTLDHSMQEAQSTLCILCSHCIPHFLTRLKGLHGESAILFFSLCGLFIQQETQSIAGVIHCLKSHGGRHQVREQDCCILILGAQWSSSVFLHSLPGNLKVPSRGRNKIREPAQSGAILHLPPYGRIAMSMSGHN